MGNCGKWENRHLWTAVDNPVDNSSGLARTRLNDLLTDKSVNGADLLLNALVDATELLTARVEALEFELNEFLGLLDQPLTPAEALERIRELKNSLKP